MQYQLSKLVASETWSNFASSIFENPRNVGAGKVGSLPQFVPQYFYLTLRFDYTPV